MEGSKDRFPRKKADQLQPANAATPKLYSTNYTRYYTTMLYNARIKKQRVQTMGFGKNIELCTYRCHTIRVEQYGDSDVVCCVSTQPNRRSYQDVHLTESSYGRYKRLIVTTGLQPLELCNMNMRGGLLCIEDKLSALDDLRLLPAR